MNEFQNIRDRISHERENPSGRVWDRLESRLDQDKGKVSIRAMYRWVGIAACVLILVAIGSNIQNDSQPVPNLTMVEEIRPAAPLAAFAVYEHASDINAVYSQNNWKGIKEGTKKSLLARTTKQETKPSGTDNDSIL